MQSTGRVAGGRQGLTWHSDGPGTAENNGLALAAQLAGQWRMMMAKTRTGYIVSFARSSQKWLNGRRSGMRLRTNARKLRNHHHRASSPIHNTLFLSCLAVGSSPPPSLLGHHPWFRCHRKPWAGAAAAAAVAVVDDKKVDRRGLTQGLWSWWIWFMIPGFLTIIINLFPVFAHQHRARDRLRLSRTLSVYVAVCTGERSCCDCGLIIVCVCK